MLKQIVVGSSLLIGILIIFFEWWILSSQKSGSPNQLTTSKFNLLVTLAWILVLVINAAMVASLIDILQCRGVATLVVLVVVLIAILLLVWVVFTVRQWSIRSAITVGILIVLLEMWVIATIMVSTSPNTSIRWLTGVFVGLLLLIIVLIKMYNTLESRK